MKITFYYTNGRTFTAPRVESFTDYEECFEYRHREEQVAKSVWKTTEYTIDKEELLGIVIKNGDDVMIRRFKPCAMINYDIVSKRILEEDDELFTFFELDGGSDDVIAIDNNPFLNGSYINDIAAVQPERLG